MSFLEHKYNLRIGNINLTLSNKLNQEVAVVTLTQCNLSFIPNFFSGAYKLLLKVEGLIVEGANEDEHLVPIVSSEHLGNSPAYFFKMDFEKMQTVAPFVYKLHCTLSSVEVIYQKVSTIH